MKTKNNKIMLPFILIHLLSNSVHKKRLLYKAITDFKICVHSNLIVHIIKLQLFVIILHNS